MQAETAALLGAVEEELLAGAVREEQLSASRPPEGPDAADGGVDA
jgi:hypothetical protein